MNKQITIFALAAAASFSALAADVQITYQGKDTSSPVVRTSQTGRVALGVLNYSDTLTGSFQAYCIEPAQPNALTSYGAQAYTVGSFTGTQATLLEGLYSSTFSSVSTATQQAAFQLAIWEIVREAGSTLSVTNSSGSFYVTAGTSTNAASVQLASSLGSLADSYLLAAKNYNGSALYNLTMLSNASYQDLVVATRITTAVPEPESYALFLAGLGAIGMIARRRLPR